MSSVVWPSSQVECQCSSARDSRCIGGGREYVKGKVGAMASDVFHHLRVRRNILSSSCISLNISLFRCVPDNELCTFASPQMASKPEIPSFFDYILVEKHAY